MDAKKRAKKLRRRVFDEKGVEPRGIWMTPQFMVY